MERGVVDLVHSATVLIESGQSPSDLARLGSGFFVAPGRVLTCAHVVGDHRPLWIRWNGRSYPVDVLAMEPKVATGPNVDPPDSAVLDLGQFTDHPVVPLAAGPAAIADRTPLKVFGFSSVRTTVPEFDSSIVAFAGVITNPAGAPLLKLSGGQLAPGMSGGPVLNLATFEVCGMTKSTVDQWTSLGGHAIPIANAIGIVVGENIAAGNASVNPRTLSSLRHAQVALDGLPDEVAALIDSKRAAKVVANNLRLVGMSYDLPTGDDERAELVARLLFRLDLDSLVSVLENCYPTLAEVTREILVIVGGCLAIDDGQFPWIPFESVGALRNEWSDAHPRVVQVRADKQRTLDFLLRRVECARSTVLGPLPFGAEIDLSTGLPADLIEEMNRNLQLHLNVTAVSDRDVGKLRKLRFFFQLVPEALNDPAFLPVLRTRYPGLRFLINSRTTPPGGPGDRDLLEVRPPIDENAEESADVTIGLFAAAVGGWR